MELVNEFIHLSVKTNPKIIASHCQTRQDNSYIYLLFHLYSKDCLLERESKNYIFQIRISKAYFEKFKDNFEVNIERQTICCNTQTKLLEIINCNLVGLHRKLFLESQILYLLYQSQKNNFTSQANCDNCAVLNRPIEAEKIQLAKRFILNNLASNLTIPIIANSVGTNQCYLKKWFKEVYQQTIFDFIQENRMVKAKQLLQYYSPNITEVAYLVGYSSLSSFSQAYKNYYGITPTEQIKQTFSNN